MTHGPGLAGRFSSENQSLADSLDYLFSPGALFSGLRLVQAAGWMAAISESDQLCERIPGQ